MFPEHLDFSGVKLGHRSGHNIAAARFAVRTLIWGAGNFVGRKEFLSGESEVFHAFHLIIANFGWSLRFTATSSKFHVLLHLLLLLLRQWPTKRMSPDERCFHCIRFFHLPCLAELNPGVEVCLLLHFLLNFTPRFVVNLFEAFCNAILLTEIPDGELPSHIVTVDCFTELFQMFLFHR